MFAHEEKIEPRQKDGKDANFPLYRIHRVKEAEMGEGQEKNDC
jgi:hypothetical protein